MTVHAALQNDRHSGLIYFFLLVNTFQKYCSERIWSMHQFLRFGQVTTSPSSYLRTAKCHVKAVLPQQGYL